MKLFFRKYGSGPPLFILHGLYGSSDNWVTIARSLSENFTVYLPDQRNHGQSPHSDEHTYDLMSQDLFELVSDLKINKFFLAGHSMGGKTAINFVMKWPEMINSLVIIDISPFKAENTGRKFYDEHKYILETILSADLTNTRSRDEAELLLSKRIDSEKTRSFIMKNLSRSGEKGFSWKLNVKALYKNLENITGGIPRPTAETETVRGFPVTFIKGGESDYLPESELKDIRKLFPAVEIVTVQDAGHWVNSERPDAIIEILLNQLRG